MKVLGFLGVLLSRRDWVYLLSLLVPFAVYNLALKAAAAVSRPGADGGLVRTLDLTQADVFFNLAYALLWLGLFAVARQGLLRWVVVVLFHVVTVLVLVVTTCAYEYLRQNGTTLDYSTVAEWIPKFEEIKPILTTDVPLFAWIVLAGALFYATLGPWLLTRAVKRWRGRFPAETPRVSFLSPLGSWILALGFGSLALLSGATTLERDPVTNMVLTGIEYATFEEEAYAAVPPGEHPAARASLAQTSSTEKRNVVLIHLESTRARSVTPYNEYLDTTPFLDELA
ncbi:MAG: sulfatase, partial [Actinomycetota bacterium]|nr:sulfatase [Actinomycetota bacterium]